jgi:hypothetical protein
MAQDPIWIVAAPGARVVLTRPDARQNVMNVAAADGDRSEYLCFHGLEFTGGSSLLRLYRCSQVWVDDCTLHDGGGVGITANSADTEYLYLTRNHIYHPGGPDTTSEGMYLGANNSECVMRYSIVALNHIHDCGGTQGDGIEVKQGSYNNWMVENYVHHTNYPCIIAYGTDGHGRNVIERNVLHHSNDNTMQVQGEALVCNNLLMAGANGFSSHDHQGQTRDLTVVNNTIINIGRGGNFSSWNNRPGLVFANNVVYSRDAEALNFPNGSAGVTLAGNVVVGAVSGVSGGFIRGRGLEDFVDVAWDASRREARPAPGSPLMGAADPAHAVEFDLHGAKRSPPHVAGAFLPAAPSSTADYPTVMPAAGGTFFWGLRTCRVGTEVKFGRRASVLGIDESLSSFFPLDTLGNLRYNVDIKFDKRRREGRVRLTPWSSEPAVVGGRCRPRRKITLEPPH